VGGRVELRGNLGGAAKRLRPHAAYARHLEQRLLDRPRHRQHHRLRRKRTAVADDDDAREDQRRIDVARQLERHVQARAGEKDRDGEDRPSVALDQRRETHGSLSLSFPSLSLPLSGAAPATAMLAPSGSSCCPLTMTASPAFTPSVSSASFGVVRPTVIFRLCAFLSAPAIITKASSSSCRIASTGTASALRRCSATISMRTGVPAASRVCASNEIRTSADTPLWSTAAGRVS